MMDWNARTYRPCSTRNAEPPSKTRTTFVPPLNFLSKRYELWLRSADMLIQKGRESRTLMEFCDRTFKVTTRIIILFVLGYLPLTSYSAANKNEQLDFNAYKDLAQVRLESTRDIIQKDVQALSSRLDIQDKRLDAQNSHLDQNLSLVGILLSALGVLLPLAGLVGYISVSRKARSEAQLEAQKEARKEAKITANEWFDAHANELQIRLDMLQKNLQKLEEQAETGFNLHIQRVQDGADLAIKEIQISVSGQSSHATDISENAVSALSEVATAAKNKPESQYTFIDWNNRAFDSYRKGEKERAARFWRDAADDESATPQQAARALSNAASAMCDLRHYGQAAEIYDELIRRFDGKGIEGLGSLIAAALNGKAGCLGLLERHDEAGALLDVIIPRLEKDETLSHSQYMAHAITNKVIGLVIKGLDDQADKFCDLFLHRFDKHTDQKIVQHLITIRSNKISILSRQKRTAEGDKIYDRTILQFGQSEDPEIKEEIGKLKNTQAFTLLCQAKEKWVDSQFRMKALHQAANIFDEIITTPPYFAIVLGNQAYCAYLLGQNEKDIREKLNKGLTMGGAWLYEETLKDLLINPVPEKDDAFKELLDEIWKNVRAS